MRSDRCAARDRVILFFLRDLRMTAAAAIVVPSAMAIACSRSPASARR